MRRGTIIICRAAVIPREEITAAHRVVITAAHQEEITAVHQEEITAAGREAVTIMRLGGAAIILRAVPAPRTRHRAATRIRA